MSGAKIKTLENKTLENKTLVNVLPLRLCRRCRVILLAGEAEVCSRCPAEGGAVTVPTGAGLTPGELEVLHLAARGLSVRQIADFLCVTPRTVSFHRENLYCKLGVSSILQAVVACAEIRFRPEYAPAQAAPEEARGAGAAVTEAADSALVRAEAVTPARPRPDPRCTTLAECIEARRLAGRGRAGCPPCLRAAGNQQGKGAESG